ncbi:uncharacterized protein B0H64DRAFT_392965 [Chaetomium fimeti]|uniref:Secreted protein n=1 Tax=Chaetomium fimeti TaxID=1854472 RepID=A0AAE0LUW4_9PEZI|nr:hypothetical protein B0H64DRAFT_392965 [Chaetomium fimeti]
MPGENCSRRFCFFALAVVCFVVRVATVNAESTFPNQSSLASLVRSHETLVRRTCVNQCWRSETCGRACGDSKKQVGMERFGR